MNLDDPFTRAVAVTIAIALGTMILLFVVASTLQSVFGLFVALVVALVGFGLVGHRAKKLVDEYV